MAMRLASLLDLTADGVIATDARGEVLLMNAVAETLTGWTAGAGVGRPLREVFHGVDEKTRAPCEDPVAHVLRYDRVERLANNPLLIARDGAERIVAGNSAPLRDRGGRVNGVLVVFHDITERVRAQQRLQQERDRARQYFDVAGVIMVALDVQGRVTAINRRGCEVLEGSESAILGRNWFDHFVPAAAREEVRAAFHQIIAGHIQPVEYYQNPLVTCTGRERLVAFHNVLIRDEAGKIAGTLSSGEDIAERRKAEEALAAERERLAVMLASIGHGVLATDADGKIVLMNQAAVDLTGWPEADAIGESLDTVLHLIDEKSRTEIAGLLADVLVVRRIETSPGPAVLIARDGVERLVAGTIAPILAGQEKPVGLVAVLWDVTLPHRLNEEQVKIQKLESVSLLAGGVAHDFSDILTAVLGNIAVVKMALESTASPDVLAMIEEVERASLRARDLTRQLLSLSKGGAPVKRAASLPEIVRDSTIFCLRGSLTRSVFLLPEDLWMAEVDPAQISQVLQNLAINADHAMPGGGTLTLRAENVRVTRRHALPLEPGPYVHIMVTDTGIGIPRKLLKRIFDPYFTTKQKGSGLGLATTLAIIQKHKGHITVQSKLGEGTTFHVYLPALEKVSAGIAVTEPVSASAPVRGSGRILVMDDDATIRDVLTQMLTRLGYQVATAEDGEEAVARYEAARSAQEPFGAVILDLTVPGGSGAVKAVARLKQVDAAVKAILFSGYATDPAMVQYREMGFAGAITKPFRLEELAAILHLVVGAGSSGA